MTPRVLVVDDHPLVATGVALALQARGWTVRTVDGPGPEDVLDLHLGVEMGSGVDLIGPLRDMGPPVVMLTAETDPYLLASCVEAGADGWIGKDAFVDNIVAVVDDVLAGRPLLGSTTREALLDDLRVRRQSLQRALSPFERLTPRERLVLGGLVEGQSVDEIATVHYVSVATVRSQVRAILQKLGVRSQLAAVAMVNRAGWKPDCSPASLGDA